MSEAKTIILTGASSYLGSFLLPELLKSSADVICLVRKNKSFSSVSEMIKVVSFDDLDKIQVVEWPSVVINLMASYGRNGESSAEMDEANVVRPSQLYRWAQRNKVEYFINIDTSLPADVSDYSMGKAAFRDFLRLNSAQKIDPKILNLRIEQFFGPGEGKDKFLRWLTDNLRGSSSLDLTKGDQIRDFLHVSDVVSGIMTLLRNRQRFADYFSTIAVGSGVGCSVRSFVEMVHGMLQSQTTLNFGAVPKRRNEPLALVADNSVLRSLGWAPRYNLELGLRHALDLDHE